MKSEAIDSASLLLGGNTFHVHWNLLGGNHKLTLIFNRLNSRRRHFKVEQMHSALHFRYLSLATWLTRKAVEQVNNANDVDLPTVLIESFHRHFSNERLFN